MKGCSSCVFRAILTVRECFYYFSRPHRARSPRLFSRPRTRRECNELFFAARKLFVRQIFTSRGEKKNFPAEQRPIYFHYETPRRALRFAINNRRIYRGSFGNSCGRCSNPDAPRGENREIFLFNSPERGICFIASPRSACSLFR